MLLEGAYRPPVSMRKPRWNRTMGKLQFSCRKGTSVIRFMSTQPIESDVVVL
jgi:hypothetical protein